MTKSVFKFSAALMAAVLLLAMLSGCGQGGSPQVSGSSSVAPAAPTPAPTPTPAPKPIVTVNAAFPGEAPKAMADVLAAINSKIAADIAVKLNITWYPADGYDDAVAADITAGKVDFLWCGSSGLAGYAAKNLIVPIDDTMTKFGQDIYKNIDAKLFDTMKVNGKLMGIPSSGNTPLSDAGHVLTYREDLRLKYNLPTLDTIDNMELYFKTVKDNEPAVTPLAAGDAAYIILKAFGPEDILDGTGGSVAFSINADNTVTCTPVQSAASFKGAVGKLRDWYMAGLLPKNIMDIKDPGAQVTAGTAAATGGGAFTAQAMQADAAAQTPGAQLADQPVSGSAKVLSGNGGNALCLAAGSKNAEQTVEFWNWVLTSQDNYDLFNYGIQGTNYDIKDNRIEYRNSDYSGFPSQVFQNMNYLRFPAGVSDDAINTFKHWNDGAVVSPLMGFTFDPTAVAGPLAKVQAVFTAYSPALYTGSSDTAAMLAEFGVKMKAAGQDAIVTEAQKQINAFIETHQ